MKQKPIIIISLILLLLSGCKGAESRSVLVATTKPVYDFSTQLCQNTGLSVDLLITENISCLHDYTLQVRQMRAIEAADAVIISGAGLEAFLDDILSNKTVIDSSVGITLHCSEHGHDHEDHHHEEDPHIWLSLENARQMAQNICTNLEKLYPQYRELFQANLIALNDEIDNLDLYGQQALSNLKHNNLVTFHDGFNYFAQYWGLNILHSLEEEAGSEASAGELKELITLIRQNNIPAIFTEESGSASAAQIIAAETDVKVYSLNMGMSEKNYFDSMYQNINALKEALE